MTTDNTSKKWNAGYNRAKDQKNQARSYWAKWMETRGDDPDVDKDMKSWVDGYLAYGEDLERQLTKLEW